MNNFCNQNNNIIDQNQNSNGNNMSQIILLQNTTNNNTSNNNQSNISNTSIQNPLVPQSQLQQLSKEKEQQYHQQLQEFPRIQVNENLNNSITITQQKMSSPSPQQKQFKTSSIQQLKQSLLGSPKKQQRISLANSIMLFNNEIKKQDLLPKEKDFIQQQETFDQLSKKQYLQSFNSIYHFKNKKKTNKNYIAIMQVLKQFIKKLKSKPGIRNKKILEIIQDKAYIYSDDDFSQELTQQNNYFGIFSNNIIRHQRIQKTCRILQSFLNRQDKFKVIDPSNKIQIFWDLFTIIYLSIILFIASITISFELSMKQVYYTQNIYFRTLTFILLILQIFVTLNTGFFEKGQLVMCRTKIIQRYLKKNLICDLLGLFPILANMSHNYQNIDYWGNYIIEFCIFFKYFTVLNIWKGITVVYSQNEYLKAYMKLIRLIIFLLCIAHCSTLGFFGLAKFQVENMEVDKTWADYDYLLQEKVWWQQYIFSFHWAISAMVTVVVYEPINLIEVCFMCVVQFITCGIFAYSINVLGQIMQDISKIKNEMKTELEIANRYMNKKQLSSNLRQRVNNYIQYLHTLYNLRTDSIEEGIVEKLSLSLREEILKEINGKIMTQFQFLKDIVSDKCLQKLIFFIEEVHVSQYDEIYKNQQQNEDCSLYFIDKGTIEFYYESIRNTDEYLPIITETLQAKNIFGTYSFITGQSREISARSLEWGTLYKITRKNFIQILQQNSKEDYERFCYIRDQLLQYNNYSVIKEKCQICKRNNHKVLDCPNAHYVCNNIQVVKNYNLDVPQIRKFQKRYQPNKFHSITTIQEQIKSVLKIQQQIQQNYDNNEDEEEDDDEDDTQQFSDYYYQDQNINDNDNNDNDNDYDIYQSFFGGDKGQSVIWENSEENENASSRSEDSEYLNSDEEKEYLSKIEQKVSQHNSTFSQRTSQNSYTSYPIKQQEQQLELKSSQYNHNYKTRGSLFGIKNKNRAVSTSVRPQIKRSQKKKLTLNIQRQNSYQREQQQQYNQNINNNNLSSSFKLKDDLIQFDIEPNNNSSPSTPKQIQQQYNQKRKSHIDNWNIINNSPKSKKKGSILGKQQFAQSQQQLQYLQQTQQFTINKQRQRLYTYNSLNPSCNNNSQIFFPNTSNIVTSNHSQQQQQQQLQEDEPIKFQQKRRKSSFLKCMQSPVKIQSQQEIKEPNYNNMENLILQLESVVQNLHKNKEQQQEHQYQQQQKQQLILQQQQQPPWIQKTVSQKEGKQSQQQMIEKRRQSLSQVQPFYQRQSTYEIQQQDDYYNNINNNLVSQSFLNQQIYHQQDSQSQNQQYQQQNVSNNNNRYQYSIQDVEDLETIMEYTYYFVEGNFSLVLKKIQQFYLKLQQDPKKRNSRSPFRLKNQINNSIQKDNSNDSNNIYNNNSIKNNSRQFKSLRVLSLSKIN